MAPGSPFVKVRQGVMAIDRFNREVEANRRRASWWIVDQEHFIAPLLQHSDPRSLRLVFSRSEGTPAGWSDAPSIAVSLGRELAGIAPTDDARVRHRALRGLARGLETNEASDLINFASSTRWAIRRLHSDLHPGNLLLGPRIVLLDWELSRSGFVFEEFGPLLAHARVARLRGLIRDDLLREITGVVEEHIGRDAAELLTRRALRQQARRELLASDSARCRERMEAAEAPLKRSSGHTD